jgi:Eukaryotic initiation factor 4E
MAEVMSHLPPTEAMDKLSLDPQTDSPPPQSTPNMSIQEPLTVFHDPKNFNVKHPLMHTWTLWFTKTPSATGPKENWADLLKEVITFDSVEEFWGYTFRVNHFSNLIGFSIILPRPLRSHLNQIMLFLKREFVLNGKMLPMKKEGNGVFSLKGILGLMNCGFTLYSSLFWWLILDACCDWRNS